MNAKITKYQKLKLKSKNKGATVIEYVMIVSLIIVAVVGAMRSLGNGYMSIYNKLADDVKS